MDIFYLIHQDDKASLPGSGKTTESIKLGHKYKAL